MRRVLVMVVALLALGTGPAFAWDPFGDELDPGPSDTAADPAPFVVPDGLYAVTDVYAGDVVDVSGATTTYSTATVHETPGTYARVVDVVGSGASSAFDGASFNGRATLPDGRSLAGTYYEDFVLTAAGFVSVNIVFFQDDSATRSTTPIAPPPAATPSPAAAPPPPARTPVPPTLPAPVFPPVPVPMPAPDPRPLPEREPARVPTVTAGVALAPDAPPLASIELLRGRTAHLWPRALVDGVATPVRTWRLVSASPDLVSRVAGGPSDACDAAWLSPTSSDSPIVLLFDVTTDAAPGRVLTATLRVSVRSPALVQ